MAGLLFFIQERPGIRQAMEEVVEIIGKRIFLADEKLRQLLEEISFALMDPDHIEKKAKFLMRGCRRHHSYPGYSISTPAFRTPYSSIGSCRSLYLPEIIAPGIHPLIFAGRHLEDTGGRIDSTDVRQGRVAIELRSLTHVRFGKNHNVGSVKKGRIFKGLVLPFRHGQECHAKVLSEVER